MKIQKAIIPAAGFGTRFLPASKAVPKEMLPIVDKPTIQYIIEEAVESGIQDILIITNPYKNAIENHFDQSFELEARLKESHDENHLKMMQEISQLANIHTIRQKNPRGLGHAILCAKAFVSNEPFAILLGDDIVVHQDQPAIKQCMDAFKKTQASIVGVQPVAEKLIPKYGIIDPINQTKNTMQIQGLLEKPSVAKAPSNLAILGRYILTPAIFPLLETQSVGTSNEIQLTDALHRLLQHEKVFAHLFKGERFDVGDKFEFLRAQIEFALQRKDLAPQMRALIKTIYERENS